MEKKFNKFLILYLLSIPLFGQEIKFELYISDSCKDTIGRVPFYNLRKNGIDYYPQDNNGIVYLKEIGQYELSTIYSKVLKTYDLKSFDNVKDTINMPSINECLEPTTHPNFIGYCCCEDKCEGKQIDYYSNGNKRIEGYFKNGKALGKLKYYYLDGTLKQVDKYNKKGILIRRKKYQNKTKNSI